MTASSSNLSTDQKLTATPGPNAPDDKMPKGQDDDDFLINARKRFNRALVAESDNRKSAIDDLKFKNGEQWPADIRTDRTLDKRPCLTINKMKTFVHQVTNNMRQNRPAINISPVGDGSDKNTANMLKGLIRQIERMSSANIAYDTAFDSAVSNGWGYWRLITEYEDDKTFDQVIKVVPIRNPFRVYLDPDHQMPDGSDAKWGFISDLIPREEFEADYPDADPVPWDQGGMGDDSFKDWSTQTHVRIAEYFCYESEKKTLLSLADGFNGYEDELPDEALKLIRSEGGKELIINEREVAVQKVMWSKITAHQILDENEWLGECIPIVKVVGDVIDIEGRVNYSGLIRDAKDPQRMKNYWAALSLDTRLPTPSGWTHMRSVSVGDELLDERGVACKVTGVSPVYVHHDCYRVTFDDGSHVVADATHRWQVQDKGKRYADGYRWERRIVTTEELKPSQHNIQSTKPLDLDEKDLPIHPYFLGVWLGDGDSTTPMITQGSQDVEELRNILSGFGLSCGPTSPCSKGAAFRFTVYGQRHKFSSLNLLGNKHVPDVYLRASREQREMLLQGLMDTDGSSQVKTGTCSFSTTSVQIRDGMQELLRSLGIKAVVLARAGRIAKMPGGSVAETAPCWQFSFTCGSDDRVFRLVRKHKPTVRSRNHRRTKCHQIKSVERIVSVPVKCVEVDSPSHLYLCGESMIPTHNTHKTELVALAPKAPFIMEEGQVEGHEQKWQQANRKSYPYLTYKGVSIGGKQAPAPQRNQMVGAPAGIIEAEQSSEQDMMGTTGVRFDATKSERIPDESGIALQHLKSLGELGSYHYTVNMIHALNYTAKQFIDLIPKVYDRKRVVTILRDDDTEEKATIEPSLEVPFQTKPGARGNVEKLYNPGIGKYAVAVTIGPNYMTKRMESSDSMLNFIKALPKSAAVIAGPIARNQDWPGADEIADRLDAMLPPNVLQKGLDQLGDIPPQAKAIIGSQSMQLKQMSEQLQGAMKDLEDRNKEFDLKDKEIDLTYDAKIAKVAADLKMHVDKVIAQRLGAQESLEKDGFNAAREDTQKGQDRDMKREQFERAQTAPVN